MNTLYIRLALGALLYLGLQTCQHPLPETLSPNDHDAMPPQEQLAQAFAQSLAVAQQHAPLALLLKESLVERFDGDYNVLFTDLAKRRLASGEHFIDARWRVAPVPGYASASAYHQAVARQHPLMQVALPRLASAHAAQWQAGQQRLTVAVAPPKHEINEHSHMPAISPGGQAICLSTMHEPAQLTLVVSANERVLALPAGQKGHQGTALHKEAPFLQTAYYDYYTNGWERYQALGAGGPAGMDIAPPDDDGGPGSGTGGGSTGGGGTGTNCAGNCQRDCDDSMEELVRFRFASVNAYEDARRNDRWFDGDLEMMAIIIFARANGNIGQTTAGGPVNKSEVKDLQWYFFNRQIVTWDPAIYGDTMSYIWYELDGGAAQQRTTSLTTNIDGVEITNTVSYTVGELDKFFLNQLVEYCHPINNFAHTYNTGYIEFNVR